MFFKEFNCIFIHIPKTGGSSIEHFFGDQIPLWVHSDFETHMHLSGREAKEKFGKDSWNKCFKFSFVRNPWARIYSWWYNTKGKNNQNDKGHFHRYLKDIPKTRFVWNQFDFLKSKNGIIELDFIGRFERLYEDFDKACDMMGVEKGTLIKSHYMSDKPNYVGYYNDESIELVSKIYKKDIDYFGYKFKD